MLLFIDIQELLSYNLLKREFNKFPELSFRKGRVTPVDIDRFSSHVNELKLDMEKGSENILKLKVLPQIMRLTRLAKKTVIN